MFLVNNSDGEDDDIYEVGLMTTGDDLRLTLRRTGGRYSLLVDNLTRNSSSTLEIAHPAFLDGETDLYVGLFGANTQSDLCKTLTIREVRSRSGRRSPTTRQWFLPSLGVERLPRLQTKPLWSARSRAA